MKAAVWYGPLDIRVQEYETPALRSGELQVAVEYAGICGTDMHEYEGGPLFIPWDTPNALTGHKGPTILGHEFAGTVTAVGPGVENFQIGDRVTSDIVLYCGECDQCQKSRFVLCRKGASLGLQSDTGGFGEIANVPAYTAYRLPDEIPTKTGAMLEPLATALRALRQARLEKGESVAVIGGGAIAFFAAQAAKAMGAAPVLLLTRGEARLRIAQELGIAYALDSGGDVIAAAKALAGGGCDVVIDTSASQSGILQALEISAVRGRVVLLGIYPQDVRISANELVFYEKELLGSIGRSRGDFERAIELLRSKQVNALPLITKIVPLDAIADGFEALRTERGKHIKILAEIKRRREHG